MTVRGDLITPAGHLRISHDLVVVVPGIMGSALTDAATGRTLWGFDDLRWYVRAWTTGTGLADLRLTPDERDGRYGRVRARGLLRFPAFGRVLAGFEPYTNLVAAIRQAVRHPDAQAVEFAYDWRLPVVHNGRLLAECLDRELRRWRDDPRHERARRDHRTGRPAQIVIVAHSMGGLLARQVAAIPGAGDAVRATVTLGTPFYGAVKAAVLLNIGRGMPIPLPPRRPWSHLLRQRADEGVRHLAASLPGVHDLLPTYRCVNDESPARRLTAADAVALGADPDLATAAQRWHADMTDVALPGHRCLVGTAQRTSESLTIRDGVVQTHDGLWHDGADGARWISSMGDGTVYRDAATLKSAADAHFYLPQQHGAVAKTDEACGFVKAVITEQDGEWRNPPMAGTELGIALPDIVAPNTPFFVDITGITRPRDATCKLINTATEAVVARPSIEVRGGGFCAEVTSPAPGLYTLRAAGSGYSAVEQMVLAIDTELDEPYVGGAAL